jgi:streptogramin lyase
MLAFAALHHPVSAQVPSTGRGTLTGTIAADQGEVLGFRVMAHNLNQRLWYVVFTMDGRYTVPQALPGKYEVVVNEIGYDSAKTTVELGPGDTKTADVTVTLRTAQSIAAAAAAGGGNQRPAAPAATSDMNPVARAGRAPAVPRKVVFFDTMEEIYPDGPGRDLLRENCTGCHGAALATMHLSREEYVKGIERMTETGPSNNPYALALTRTVFSKKQKALLAEYLYQNFGEQTTVERRPRIDPPPVLDESIVSKIIYVLYDIPEGLPFPSTGDVVGAPMIDGVIEQGPPASTNQWLGNAHKSPWDKWVYFTSKVSSSILRLDPTDLDPIKRWTNYPIKGDPYVFAEGIGVDRKGLVYWSEDLTARLGQLDPVSGKQVRYSLPARAGIINEVVVDQDDNVGFSMIYGGFIGVLDAKTRKIHQYPTPTPDNGVYGLAVDQQGNFWGAGWAKGMVVKWDKEAESIKEYPAPASWGQVRRIGVDSKGIVWGSEFNVGGFVRIEPATGKVTEIKIPLKGARPYDCWPDKDDNIWMPDQMHSVLIKYNQKTRKFTYYPMPQPRQSLNKLSVAADNTMWLPTRAVPLIVGVHFYPEGYTDKAPAIP